MSKIVWAGEWVKVRNFMNRRFRAADLCSICRRGSCAMVWYSIKTREVRCLKCFNTIAAHEAELDRRL